MNLELDAGHKRVIPHIGYKTVIAINNNNEIMDNEVIISRCSVAWATPSQSYFSRLMG